MKIENNKGLRILRPNEGLLLFKKDESRDKREYYEIIYLGKFDTMENYGEVTYDYVYGKNYDDKIELIEETNGMQQNSIDLQSEVIDFLLFGDSTLLRNQAAAMMIRAEINYHPMAVYSASRIIKGKISYQTAILKFPDLKNEIDQILTDSEFSIE